MTGRDRKDVLNERNGFGDAAKEQIRSQRILGQISGYELACQKSAKLRGENETLRSLRIVERLNAHRISKQKKGALRRAPNSECEHAADYDFTKNVRME